MAGEYFYVPPSAAQSTKSGKVLMVFIVFACFCLAGELIWLFGISPFMPFSRIDIVGNEGISRSEILARAGVTADLTFVSADVNAMEKSLMGIASLESARVFKRFPGSLRIVVQKRQPAASAFASLDGVTVPVLFDSQGVIYQIGGEKKHEFLSGVLPVISGLAIEEPFPGMKLPALFVPLLEEIEKISISDPALLATVSEIKINRRPYDSFDLILYPVHKKMRVRLSELSEEILRYTLLMVDVLSSNESGIESFDFRSGIASYIPKEASPE